MPAKSRSKKHSSEKRKEKIRSTSKATPSQVEVPVTQRTALSEVVKPSVTPPASSYAYIGRELKRIAVVTGLVLAILIILAVYLR